MNKRMMTKEQAVLVDRINVLCKERGDTYYTLAYKASIPFTTLMHIIRGDTKNPGLFTVMKICDAFEMSLKEFFDTEEFTSIVNEID